MRKAAYIHAAGMVIILLAAFILPCGAGAAELVAHVVKVYDGDTILVELAEQGPGRPLREKVRFIGMDCPEVWENEKFKRDMKYDRRHTPAEVLALGEEAKRFTEAACPPGSTVRLELDAERRDKYGRLLAYVWVNQGPGAVGQGKAKERMLNAELIKVGLAQLMTIPPDVKYADYFGKLQRKARAARRGFWAKQ